MPGTSRSGVTMTMARTLGLTREGGRAILVLARGSGHGMAGAYEMLKLLELRTGQRSTGRDGLGVVVAAITGYLLHRVAVARHQPDRTGAICDLRFAIAGLMFWLFA